MIEWLDASAASAENIIAFVKDAATAIAVLLGALIAWRGLHTWQAQLRGTSEYELAKRLMNEALRLRDGLILTREPNIKFTEVAAAFETSKHLYRPDDPGFEGHRFMAVYSYRWDRYISEAFDRYIEAVREQEIFTGPGIHGVAYPLRGLAHELYDSMVGYAVCLQDPDSCSMSRDELVQAKAVAIGQPADDYEERLVRAVDALHDALRPVLGNPLTRWQRFRRWLWWKREFKDTSI